MPIPTTPERNNAPVPLTPEQQQKLQQEFRQANFTQITDFLQEWCRQSDSLGEPPTEAEVRRILYDRVSICEYWLIDGLGSHFSQRRTGRAISSRI
jgi:aromatic ring-cleaving dioxygenase